LLTATAGEFGGACAPDPVAGDASGVLLSLTVSLTAGSATGVQSPTVAGVTLTVTESIIAGTATGGSGAVDGEATGVTLTITETITAGTAIANNPTAWSQSDYWQSVAVEHLFPNDGLCFESQSSACKVRAVTGRSTGKYYFEGITLHGSATAMYFGICESTATLSTITNSSSSAIAGVTIGTGAIRHNNSTFATLTNSGLGSLVCIAVDLDARLFWARIGDGNWNNDGSANPATGTGGLTLAGTLASGTVMPYFAADTQSARVRIGLFSTDEHCVFTPPSGFSTWGGSLGNPSYNGRARYAYQMSHKHTPLSAAELGRLDTLMDALDTASVWGEIDYFAVPACASPAAGTANLKNYTNLALGTHSPGIVHRPGKGFTAPGKPNVVSANPGHYQVGVENGWTNFVRDDAHMAVYHQGARYENSTSVSSDVGSTNAMIGGTYSGGIAIRMNAATTDAYADVPYDGHILWNRTGASAIDIYRNGSSVKTSTRASAALAANNMKVGQVGTVGSNSLRGIVGVVHLGGALTGTQITDIYNAVNTYMTAQASAHAITTATQQFTKFTNIEAFQWGTGSNNFPWTTHDGVNFPTFESNFMSSGWLPNSLHGAEIYIPEDVKIYRVWLSVDMGSGSTAVPWPIIYRNRAVLGLQLYDHAVMNTGGGTTEHTTMAHSGLLLRAPADQPEAIVAAVTFSNTVTVPVSDNTFMYIEVLERY
jgi:hypothetical protein